MDIQKQILWSDDTLLAVNKPAGLRTIADGYNPNLPHLAGLLQERFGRIWVVHRLDKDTSGIILFALNAETHRALNDQFEKRETHKVYHAIVPGIPDWHELTVSLPLKTNGDRKHRTVIDHQSGKPAETEFHLLQEFRLFCLLAALPHTGYTHQIRAHLAAAGYPILADPLYQSLQPETEVSKAAKGEAKKLPIRRTALHAFEISFRHPTSGNQLTLEAPYPEDFQQTIELLGSMMNK